MVIFDEETKPLLLDSINTPLKTSHFWVLDLEEKDFQLTKLEVLEEHTTPMLVVKIYGYAIEFPADWNILIVSPETNQLDVAEIAELSRGDFRLFVFKHANNKILTPPVNVIHYEPKAILHTPSLGKHQMLCHALGPDAWVCVSPIDNYNRYLKGSIANDLIY